MFFEEICVHRITFATSKHYEIFFEEMQVTKITEKCQNNQAEVDINENMKINQFSLP